MKEIYNDFEAELYLEDGELLAEGTASIDFEEKCVNFSGDFVPLYELETKVYVMRKFKGKDVHKFSGEVYISDKQVMRIVSITDELLEGSEDCYSSNIEFNASLSPVTFNENNKKSTIMIFNNIEFDIAINDMTANTVRFDVLKSKVVSNIFKKLTHKTEFDIEKIELEQHFSIIKTQILNDLRVQIEIKKAYHFGDYPRLECKIINMSTQDRDKLKEILWTYNIENNKLFN